MGPVIKDDVKYITGDYLINNIELAFKVWEEQPWGKDVPFDVFCEEILPYRLANEPLENWREKVLAGFAAQNSSFKTQPNMTAVKACFQVNSQLPLFRLSLNMPDMNYSMIMTTTSGICDEMAALAIFTMRALGIPVAKDYTPKWPNSNVGHAWNSVYESAGKHFSFMGAEANPSQDHIYSGYSKSKIYRQTFAKQKNINADDADIPSELREQYMKDVSHEYFADIDGTSLHSKGGCNVEVPVKYQPTKSTGYAYLASIERIEWSVIGWGEADAKTVRFGTAGRNVLYLPLYYADGVQTPVNYPFLFDDNDNIRFFEPDTNNYRQCTIIDTEVETSPVGDFVYRMVNGVFEGANQSDFSDAKVLHTIEKMDGAYFHSAKIRSSESYRYVRYVSPENSYCNVAEIVFYNDKGEKLGGNPFGSPPSVHQNSTLTYDKAFDGDVLTFFDSEQPSGSFAGLDLGEPQTISEIHYLPRNEGEHCIYEGHIYDLFCWKDGDWQLLERQTAPSNYLDLRVPANGIFYIRNVTAGKVSTCFTVNENGKRSWFRN
jgi:hypothetical protein